MTQNSTSPGTTKQGNNGPGQGGNSPITLIAIVIGVIVVGAVAYKTMHKDAPQPNGANAPAAHTEGNEPAKSKVVEPKDPTATAASTSPAAPSATASTSPAAAKPVVTGAAKDIVTSLAALDPRKGPITKEQAEKWKQAFKDLIAQGKDAVPAIKEFLERNVEQSYKTAGGESLGYSSLRASMIDALAQIGGPDATAALLETLQTTALPSEIQQLSAALNQLSPGQYNNDILNAARQTLDVAVNGGLGKEDAAPLFKILGQDPNSIADLQKAANAYKYYPIIALGDLPNDAGVPTLIQMSKDPNAPNTVPVVLAEKALSNPDAMTALEQIFPNLPPQTQQQVIAALTGKQYSFGFDGSQQGQNNPAPNPGVDCQYNHIEWNNQNFSLCQSPNFQPAQGINALKQLLAVTTDPNVRNGMQDHINQLQGH